MVPRWCNSVKCWRVSSNFPLGIKTKCYGVKLKTNPGRTMAAIFPLFLSCWTAKEWSTSSMGVPLTMTTLSFSLQTKQKNGIGKTPSLPLWMVHLGTNKSKRLKALVSNDSWGLICQLGLSSSEERTQETLRALWTVSPGNHLQRRTQTHGVPPGVTGRHYGLGREGTSGPPYP